MGDLGVGAVYCPGLHPLFAGEPGLLPVVEVEPQMFWRYRPGRLPRYQVNEEAIARIAALPQHKIIHGVGFPVGGSRAPDPLHLAPLRESVRRLDARWASEHLAFNVVSTPQGERQCGFFLPPLQTPAGIATAADHIRAMAGRLDVPFAFETGFNYLRPMPSELPDGEFFAGVAAQSGCDILLDLHNLWVNERNGRQPLAEVLAALPLQRVREVHLAGGVREDGYWLDAHSGEVPEALMDIAADVVARLPGLGAIVFEVLPEHVARMGLARVARQVRRLHDIWDRRGARCVEEAPHPIRRASAVPVALPQAGPIDADAWERALTGAIEVGGDADAVPAWLRGDPGVGVYRRLIREARQGSVADILPLTCTLLMLTLGEAAMRECLATYARKAAPEFFAHAEAAGFARFLEGAAIDVPWLHDVLGFERAHVDAVLHGRASVVEFDADPSVLLGALDEGRLPRDPPTGRYSLAIEAAPG